MRHIIAISILWLMTMVSVVHAGTVLDDILNAASLGEYHRQYQLAKDRVDRDIAQANRIHQENLSAVKRNKAISLLKLYESQFNNAALQYVELKKMEEFHVIVLEALEDAVEDKVNADQEIKLALEHSESLSFTYGFFASIAGVPFGRDYFEEVKLKWWDAVVALEEVSSENSNNMAAMMKLEFDKLDSKSLEYLYTVVGDFSKLVSALIESKGASMITLSQQYNTQLTVANNLGANSSKKIKECCDLDTMLN